MNENEDYGIKISLKEPDDFLLVKESLTRMGVASNKTKTLYQSCHLLHKRGEYRIMMFKELFRLDGRHAEISEEDYMRRNLIAYLLHTWGLCEIINIDDVENRASMNSIKIIPYKEKSHWELVQKYTIGNKKR